MTKRRRALLLALLALPVAAGAAWAGYRVGVAAFGDRAPPARPAAVPRAHVTEWLEIPLPDAAFHTLEGEEVTLDRYRGRIVLVNFWGTWCPPCRVEIPHLIAVQGTLEELGGTIVAPAVDSGSPEEILAFADEFGINYPVWVSDYETAVGRFQAAGYPFSLLIDERGVIRRRYLGPQTARTLLRDIGTLAVEGAGRPSSDGAVGAGPAAAGGGETP